MAGAGTSATSGKPTLRQRLAVRRARTSRRVGSGPSPGPRAAPLGYRHAALRALVIRRTASSWQEPPGPWLCCNGHQLAGKLWFLSVLRRLGLRLRFAPA